MLYRVLTLLTVVFLALLPLAANASLQTKARQAIVYDFNTGLVLFEKNADEQMPTSSMSKVMTMYLVFDALKNDTIKLDDTFKVSEKAWRKGGSKMFVEVDKQVKVEDLIRGVVVQSGNDATIVLAEGIAGSEFAFADMLNQKAQELGMTNSHFVNASGWPDPEHYSSARDLAILGTATIKNFPNYYKYYAEPSFTYNNIKQDNRNPLIYRNIGADGIKTGHTEIAGYGLIGSGVYKDRRVVIVINGLESSKERADESAKLLEWGLKSFESKPLFKAGQSVIDAPVALGKQKQVQLVVGTDIAATIPKGSSNALKIQAHFKSPLIAPVKEGEEIGTLRIHAPGMAEQNTPLYAGLSVEKQGFFLRTFAKFGYLLGK